MGNRPKTFELYLGGGSFEYFDVDKYLDDNVYDNLQQYFLNYTQYISRKKYFGSSVKEFQDKELKFIYSELQATGKYTGKELETITKNCFAKKMGPKKFKIILTEGLNRQIRRMCESLGYRVQSLKRVRIMNIKLDLPVGKYREFTKKELLKLNELLENSSKTFD